MATATPVSVTLPYPVTAPFSAAWRSRRIVPLVDLLSLSVSLYLAYRMIPIYRPYLRRETFAPGDFASHAWLLLLICPIWYLLFERANLHGPASKSWLSVVRRLLSVQLLGVAVLSAVLFLFKQQTVSRLLVLGFCFLAVPLVLAGRILVFGILRARKAHLYGTTRVLVIGSRDRATEFIRLVRHSEVDQFEVVGCLDPEISAAPATVEGIPMLGSTDGLCTYLFAHPVDVVVFAMPLDRVPGATGLITAVLDLGLRVAILPDFYLERHKLQPNDHFCTIDVSFPRPMLVLSSVPSRRYYLIAKRTLDVLLSGSLLLILAPLLGLIALLVKITPPYGPILYRWHVLGMNKRPFVSYKFRTMVPDADRLRSEFDTQNEMEGPVFKIRNDPRVTPLGRFLRRYSLDELPQLYSVLKADMSLVGPRPPFPQEAARYAFWQRRKLCVKPGITCLWQVNGRNHIRRFDDWVRMDLEYIRNASLWLDLKILLKTIPVVLSGRGAY